MPRRALALLPALSLAACGGLANPDLGSGALAGRLQGATGAAYLYPLGRPDLVARPATDGSWTLPSVPVETSAIVVVDGAPGAWRAALVPVTVASAALTAAPDVDAAALPAAGRVGLVARIGGGCDSTATRFTAIGTDRVDVPVAGARAAAILDPLPAGTFEVVAGASGFTSARVTVAVASATTTAYDVPMRVDPADPSPGCTAAGASCRSGLLCDPGDGVCYECLSDADCTASAAGETACRNHACMAPASGLTCDPCGADSDCSTGACASMGFCTRACTTSADCPAGFECASDGARAVCLAPSGCADAKEELGSQCFFDAGCSDLARAVCFGAQPTLDPPLPGYCTGRCSAARPDDCTLVPGYACNASSGVCERIP